MAHDRMDRFAAQAKVMKALGHPTRVCLVHELGEGERCVCELTDIVGADISTVSKHLSILKDAGIVQAVKRGTSMYYSLRMSCVLNFFVCVDTVIEDQIKQQLELMR